MFSVILNKIWNSKNVSTIAQSLMQKTKILADEKRFNLP